MEMPFTPRTAPNATVLPVVLSHVTLIPDSVDVNLGSLGHTVTAVRMVRLDLTHALVVGPVIASPLLLCFSHVTLRLEHVCVSLESTDPTVNTVPPDTGTMDLTAARSATAEEGAVTRGQENADVQTG